jgi:cytochrome c oxidase assembly protein subunit 15
MQPDSVHAPIIHRWILACITCVVLMVFIGGVTRLTESGLSIVEWKPISGILPPFSEEAWQKEFTDYQASPEFVHKNAHFSLDDFKGIFWLEYIHRVMGRITGLVFLLPLIYFGVKHMLPKPLLVRMSIITAMVGLQGAVGWVMVASGLVDQPRVAPVKLGAHLMLATVIFTWLIHLYITLTTPRGISYDRNSALYVRALLGLVLVQMFLGALVAGLDAGMIYNTFPLMDGKIAPSPLYMSDPWWVNHLEYIPLVQFQHRVGAIILVIASFAFMYYAYPRMHPTERERLKHLMWVLIAQFGLGVYTLISVVNIWFASLHQLTALLLVALLVRLMYALPLQK